MRIDAVSTGGDPPHEVNVIVEVPVGGEPIKYEMDKNAGTLVVDRFLYTSMRYPGNYGFIPHTLSGDGDPVDVLIANQRGIVPGAVIAVRPVGVFLMQDEAGVDEKIVAVPVSRLTRRYENVQDYFHLPDITVKQIEHFFEHYKDLEERKWVKVIGWGNVVDAKKLILASIARAAAAVPARLTGRPRGRVRRLPARAAGAAQDGMHGVDLAAVHLEHVHVGVAHEHGHPDADAGLGIGEDAGAASWPAFPMAAPQRSSRHRCSRTYHRRSPGAGSC